MAERKKKQRKKVRAAALPPTPEVERQWEDDVPTTRCRRDCELTETERATIRYAAGLHYTTDTNGCTLRSMKKLPQFAGITIAHLEQWCEEDRWHARRHENLARWKALIEERVGQSIVQQRMESLQAMKDLAEQSMSMLGRDEENELLIRPKSWEGVANVTLRLHKLIDEFRSDLASQMVPDTARLASPKDEGLPEIKVLDPGEAQAIAHTLLRRRQMPVDPPTPTAPTADTTPETEPDKDLIDAPPPVVPR